MRRRIVRLPVPFIGWRREERYCRGGEIAGDEGSFSMLPFRGDRGWDNARFVREKEHVGRLLVLSRRGDRRVQWCGGG
jgi:hypothetical protein